MTLKVGLVGLGGQTLDNHLPACLEARDIELVAACDPSKERRTSKSIPDSVTTFPDVDSLVRNIEIDLAIVSVPHNMYFPILSTLSNQNIHILKEKPFAINMSEAINIHNMINDSNSELMVTLVRRYHPIYSSFHQLVRRIGDIHSIEAKYTMNIAELDAGWRSSLKTAGGGALLDMGYHHIDLLVWYLGLPSRVHCMTSMHGRAGQKYDVEDTAHVHFQYGETNERPAINGTLIVSRAFPSKSEQIQFIGSHGSILISRGEVGRYSTGGDLVESLNRTGTWLSASIDQVEFFSKVISSRRPVSRPLYFEHFMHMAFLEACYKSSKEGDVRVPSSFMPDL